MLFDRCLTTFLHCVFSNVPSSPLPDRRHCHIGCIYLTFLHCVFSNVIWPLPGSQWQSPSVGSDKSKWVRATDQLYDSNRLFSTHFSTLKLKLSRPKWFNHPTNYLLFSLIMSVELLDFDERPTSQQERKGMTMMMTNDWETDKEVPIRRRLALCQLSPWIVPTEHQTPVLAIVMRSSIVMMILVVVMILMMTGLTEAPLGCKGGRKLGYLVAAARRLGASTCSAVLLSTFKIILSGCCKAPCSAWCKAACSAASIYHRVSSTLLCGCCCKYLKCCSTLMLALHILAASVCTISALQYT